MIPLTAKDDADAVDSLPGVRKSDLVILVTTLGITTAGAFMVIPFLAIYLTTSRHLSIASAGAVLAIMIVLERGGTFVTGILSDRSSPKLLMVSGMAVNSAGLLLLAFSDQLPPIMVGAVLLGSGTAFFLPACKAVLAGVAEVYGPRAFALRTTATNAGSAVGPLIGGIFYGHFTTLLVAAALLHLLCAFPIGRLNVQRPSRGTSTMGIFTRAYSILSDSAAMVLMIASIGFWICFSQFTLSFPLHAKNVLGSAGAVGIFTTLNAVVIVGAQLLVVRIALKRSDQAVGVIVYGMLMMAVAFGALMLRSDISALVVFTVFFSLAELLIGPSLDSAAHAISPRGQEATYLGFVSVGWAIGAPLGNYIAVVTHHLHLATWGACALIATVTAVAFHQFKKPYRRRLSPPSEAAI
ncbi:MFS transporter [Saccharopolyspora shandongensis]|uniref:MFS transporter n=1 Tax=Saccharopolyspora shandongensis TaxID=418495 RepID=UPI003409893F